MKKEKSERLATVAFLGDAEEPKYDFTKDTEDTDDDGKFEEWNPEVLRVMGVTAAEMKELYGE